MTHIWERAIGCNITKVKENAERQWDPPLNQHNILLNGNIYTQV
jgi:hypothetical protein